MPGGTITTTFIVNWVDVYVVQFGQHLELSCDLVPGRDLIPTWMKGELEMLFGNQTLVIGNVTLDDLGNYTCVVIDMYGHDIDYQTTQVLLIGQYNYRDLLLNESLSIIQISIQPP